MMAVRKIASNIPSIPRPLDSPENPQASFLFKAASPGFQGVRLALELVKTEESGAMLAKIKENADATVGPGTGAAVTHAAWFTVTEVRSLI